VNFEVDAADIDLRFKWTTCTGGHAWLSACCDRVSTSRDAGGHFSNCI